MAKLFFAQLGELHAFELDAAALDGAVAAHVAHDGHGHGGLAAAGLAHQADTFALVHGQREIDNGWNLAGAGPVGEIEILDIENRRAFVEFECHCVYLYVSFVRFS